MPLALDDRSAVTAKVDKLNAASLRRIIDPDVDLPGALGPGQVLPDELLHTSGLDDIELTPEQKVVLSREQLASIVGMGLRFEAVLMAGLSMEIVESPDLTDPRVVYVLHEMGEETRHSRLFSRLLGQLKPKAENPLDRPLLHLLQRFGILWITTRRSMLYVLILGGEEIPDLFQKLAVENEGTDPFVREVNRYHRSEEARHLSYARSVLAEHWANAPFTERFAVRHIAPVVIKGMFDTIVHPGVYDAAGLPGWKTWRRVRKSERIVGLRHEAARPIVKALRDAGVLKDGKLPRSWRRLAGAAAD